MKVNVYKRQFFPEYSSPILEISSVSTTDVIATSDWALPVVPFEDETNQDTEPTE